MELMMILSFKPSLLGLFKRTVLNGQLYENNIRFKDKKIGSSDFSVEFQRWCQRLRLR